VTGDAPAATEAVSPGQRAEDLWERHGSAVYALALGLLGDEAAAGQAVTRAIADKRIIHKNKAARHKSRLAQQVKALSPRT